MVLDHGDDLVPGIGLDDTGEFADKVFLRQGINEGILEFLGNEIAAVRIRADLQHIEDIRRKSAGADHVPESRLVLLRIAPLPHRGNSQCRRRLCRDGLAGGEIQFVLDFLLTLQPLDFLAQSVDVLLHAGVCGIVLGGEDALLRPMGFQESLCSLPSLGAFCTEFVDRGSHKKFLLQIVRYGS